MSRRRNKNKNKPPVQQAPNDAQTDVVDIPNSQPILEAAEKKVEEQLLPEIHESYLKIVVAGMHAGLDGGPNSIMAKLKTSKDPIADCAKGAIGIVIILKHQSKGIMPVKAMVPAASTLMFKALSFADTAGIVKVGNEELARATHIFAETFLHKLGVTPKMLSNAMSNVHRISQDPVAMELMKRKTGFVKHPDASEPTPLPKG